MALSKHDIQSVVFPKCLPRWVCVIHWFVDFLLLASIAIALVQAVVLMYPTGRWWDLFSFAPKHRYELHFYFTSELLFRGILSGSILFLGTNIFTLIEALRGKLRWNTYLAWLCIDGALLFVAFVGLLPCVVTVV